MAQYKFIKDYSFSYRTYVHPNAPTVTKSYKVGDVVDGCLVTDKNYIYTGLKICNGKDALTQSELFNNMPLGGMYGFSIPMQYLKVYKNETPTPPEPTTKYYNATVNVAKYSYKVGDAIKVVTEDLSIKKPLTTDSMSAYFTIDKSNEKWNIGGIAGLKEITIGTEIPASEIETKGGTVAPTTTIFTTKNILIAGAIILGAYLLFFSKEPILKFNK